MLLEIATIAVTSFLAPEYATEGNRITIDNINMATITPAPLSLVEGTPLIDDSYAFADGGTVEWKVAAGEYEVFVISGDEPNRVTEIFTFTVEITRIDLLREILTEMLEVQQRFTFLQNQLRGMNPDYFEIIEALDND